MGVVYRARDRRLGRDVAIKFLTEGPATRRSSLRRFAQEARAASALNHPNIVTIYDIGEHEGLPYIVMELVEGRTLRQMVANEEPLPGKRVLRIAAQIASGLAKAHAAGIVHRDLKPENVMITPDGLVKVLDFGLAKLTGLEGDDTLPDHTGAESSDAPHEAPSTRPGTLLGTVGYMSPEQALGQPIDSRADQFAFGTLVYEMLSGRSPFRRSTPVHTLAAILHDEPEALRPAGYDVPAPLVEITRRCLSKRPEDRFGSTSDLADELHDLLENLGETGATGANPALETVITEIDPRLSSRRRGPAIAVGVVALLGISWIWSMRSSSVPELPAEKHVAVLLFEATSGQPSAPLRRGLLEELTNQLAQLERYHEAFWVVPADEMTKRSIGTPAQARRAFGTNLAVAGQSEQRGGIISVEAHLIDTMTGDRLRSVAATSSLADLTALRESLVHGVLEMLELPLNVEEGRVLTAGGTEVAGAYQRYLEGQGYLLRYESEDNLDRAISAFQQAVQQDPDYALAYAGLGEAYWRRYELDRQLSWIELARQFTLRALDLNDLLAPVHVSLGWISVGLGELEAATGAFERALALDPFSADALRGLANAHEAQGKLDLAEAAHRRAIELKPSVWSSHNQYGVFLVRQGRFEESVQALQRVLELTPDNIRAYNNLGGIYHLMGKTDEAVEVLERSIAIEPSYEAYSNLATVRFFRREYEDSARWFERALELADGDYRVWRNLAAAYYWTPGLRERSQAAYERAAELAERQLELAPNDANLLIQLADCYAMLGTHERARELTLAALSFAPVAPELAYFAGLVFERLGERNEALHWVHAALAGGYSLAEVSAAPELFELRADPRYQGASPMTRETDPGGG